GSGRRGRELAAELVEEAVLPLVQVLDEMPDQVVEVLRRPQLAVREDGARAAEAAVPPMFGGVEHGGDAGVSGHGGRQGSGQIGSRGRMKIVARTDNSRRWRRVGRRQQGPAWRAGTIESLSPRGCPSRSLE